MYPSLFTFIIIINIIYIIYTLQVILGRRRRGAGGDDPWYQLSNLKNDVMSFVTLSPPHLTFSGDCHVESSIKL